MKEVTILLQELATKLGTTVEKLWGVLLAQAPISGAIGILQFVFLATIWAIAYRFIRKMGTETCYQRGDKDMATLGLIAGAVVAVIVCLCRLENIAAAFLNPEYWALQRVLSVIK